MYISNVGYSTSIFQILFTDIYSHATFVCVFYLCGIAIQHSCFIVIHNSTPIFQNPIFNFFNSTLRIDNSTYTFQILFTFDIRLCILPQPLQHRMLGVCVLWCRVRYACNAIINILVWTLNFPFPVSPLQSRGSAHFPGGGGDSHMKQTGMLVGHFEFNP